MVTNLPPPSGGLIHPGLTLSKLIIQQLLPDAISWDCWAWTRGCLSGEHIVQRRFERNWSNRCFLRKESDQSWRFPESWGVPWKNHPYISGISPNKNPPAIGVAPFMEAPICAFGSKHATWMVLMVIHPILEIPIYRLSTSLLIHWWPSPNRGN